MATAPAKSERTRLAVHQRLVVPLVLGVGLLLGLAKLHPEGLEQRVRPCMVAENTVIGALPGVTNAVVAEGDFVGQVALTGPGAGEGTSSSSRRTSRPPSS